MQDFFQNLIEEPTKLVGIISAILVSLLAIINIAMFLRPSARLKRTELREKYKQHKKMMQTNKFNKSLAKDLKKIEKTQIKELGFTNVYKDDKIELSSYNKKIKLVFKLDDDENTTFADELTNAYKHAADMILTGKAKLIV